MVLTLQVMPRCAVALSSTTQSEQDLLTLFRDRRRGSGSLAFLNVYACSHDDVAAPAGSISTEGGTVKRLLTVASLAPRLVI
jgi:hypothetical protein